MDKEANHIFKVVIVGDSGVGKSCILQRFADDYFPTSYIATIGVDFKIRSVYVNGEYVKLTIWDTAGQERFRTITKTYYRGTHGVIVVYDVTNKNSFDNMKRWLKEIHTNCETVDKILVGNKKDLTHLKRVPFQQANELAKRMGIKLVETSAKENININLIFEEITVDMLETKQRLKEIQQVDTVKLKQVKRKKKSCC